MYIIIHKPTPPFIPSDPLVIFLLTFSFFLYYIFRTYCKVYLPLSRAIVFFSLLTIIIIIVCRIVAKYFINYYYLNLFTFDLSPRKKSKQKTRVLKVQKNSTRLVENF